MRVSLRNAHGSVAGRSTSAGMGHFVVDKPLAPLTIVCIVFCGVLLESHGHIVDLMMGSPPFLGDPG
jgi:hypothetical protein